MDNLTRIEESLEYNFLYGNDPVSMDVLLSIMGEGTRLDHLEPRYTMMKKINTSLRRALGERNDKEYIIRALNRLINDDVNRFELHIIIKAYALGKQDSVWVSRLEMLALSQYSPEALGERPYLYHQAKSGKAMKLQSELFHERKLKTRGFRQLKKLADAYCKALLRKKIYKINDYMDRQIVLDFEEPTHLKVEESPLTIKDLNFLYYKVNRYLVSNSARVYKQA
jgi:hypothetical protein